MIGGMATATLLALVVIPVLYYMWRRTAAARPAKEEGSLMTAQ